VTRLYPEVERLYEHVEWRVLFEADVPDELDSLERGRVVSEQSDIDAVALQRHCREVRDADNERDHVYEHDRQAGPADAAPDSAMTRVPNEQISASSHIPPAPSDYTAAFLTYKLRRPP